MATSGADEVFTDLGNGDYADDVIETLNLDITRQDIHDNVLEVEDGLKEVLVENGYIEYYNGCFVLEE